MFLKIKCRLHMLAHAKSSGERIIVPILRRIGKQNFTYYGTFGSHFRGQSRKRRLIRLFSTPAALSTRAPYSYRVEEGAGVENLVYCFLLRRVPNFKTKCRRIGTIIRSQSSVMLKSFIRSFHVYSCKIKEKTSNAPSVSYNMGWCPLTKVIAVPYCRHSKSLDGTITLHSVFYNTGSCPLAAKRDTGDRIFTATVGCFVCCQKC